jgi:hypothetical protein
VARVDPSRHAEIGRAKRRLTAGLAMPALREAELARQAGASRQAVNDGVRRGLLRAGPDGLIDVEIEPNKSWLALHRRDHDIRDRWMPTYARVTGVKRLHTRRAGVRRSGR